MQERRVESNGLGLAGFVVSLVGLLVCGGLISPVGLVMSVLAMRREPKGFAIAGLVLGLIGSLWLILGVVVTVMLVVMGVGLAALGIAASAGGFGGAVDIATDQFALHSALHDYTSERGVMPTSADDLALEEDALTDHWGRPYRFEFAPDGAVVMSSMGPDGASGTDDDFVIESRVDPGSGAPDDLPGASLPDSSRGREPAAAKLYQSTRVRMVSGMERSDSTAA